jgi:2-amino-4-hydroxy-6-hydroxymethyldihydropteridine diphosphokinase
MPLTSYAIALGSNRRTRFGSPEATVRAAAEALAVDRLSPVRTTRAVGPAGRAFANAIALLRSNLDPPALLARLKRQERAFGRRPGRKWGARALDLDIVLWSGGRWRDRRITVPHPQFRIRRFVLEPLADVAAAWRDPGTGLRIRHLLHRLRRPRPVDHAHRRT